jgi:hypothetical protein
MLVKPGCEYSANICITIEDLQLLMINCQLSQSKMQCQFRCGRSPMACTSNIATDALDQNVQTMYLIILGQCTDTMRVNLEGHSHYAAVAGALDMIGLF